MEVEIRKWGNSKAIIIPGDEVDRSGLNVGDRIDVFITKKDELSGFGFLKGKKYRPFKREHADLDREVG